jgi:hypothetical protein
MIERANNEGGIVVAQLGNKRLADGRLIKFTLEARVEHTDAGGAHKRR